GRGAAGGRGAPGAGGASRRPLRGPSGGRRHELLRAAPQDRHPWGNVLMVTLITGASSGVGARLAERLAAGGATGGAAARRADRLAALDPGAGRSGPLPRDGSDRAAGLARVACIEAESGPIPAPVDAPPVCA